LFVWRTAFLSRARITPSGRTATTIAMGKGSTQHQHLIQTEVPKKLLEEWLAMWTHHYDLPGGLRVQMRPHRAGSELLELGVYDKRDEKLANVIFAPIHDRRDRSILSVRDQNTFAESMRKKRLMTLVHLFLVHRFKGGLGALRHADRGQPVPGGKDEDSRDLPRVHHRGRPNHRRRRQPPADLRAFGAGSRGVGKADSQGAIGAAKDR
jgi:hypothetical protein